MFLTMPVQNSLLLILCVFLLCAPYIISRRLPRNIDIGSNFHALHFETIVNLVYSLNSDGIKIYSTLFIYVINESNNTSLI